MSLTELKARVSGLKLGERIELADFIASNENENRKMRRVRIARRIKESSGGNRSKASRLKEIRNTFKLIGI